MLKVTMPRAIFWVFLTVLLLPQGLSAGPQAEQTLPAKKPGVKRLGVFSGGPQGDAVAEQLLKLLQGDPTLLEVVPVTNRVDAFRQAEAQKKECDYLLEATFTEVQAKAKGGFLSKAKETAKSLNNDSGAFRNSTGRIQNTNQKADSIGDITKTLTPDPKDKVRVGYKLVSLSSKQAVLTQDKEITASDLPSFLEKFANDVVTQTLK